MQSIATLSEELLYNLFNLFECESTDGDKWLQERVEYQPPGQRIECVGILFLIELEVIGYKRQIIWY